jgi:hypothetical protein
MGQRRIVKYFNGGSICNCGESDEYQLRFEERVKKQNDQKYASKSEKEDSSACYATSFHLNKNELWVMALSSGAKNELLG